MAHTLKIATAQTPVTTDVRVNGLSIRGVLRQAESVGARLVQFPEGALSGYTKSQIRNWADVDWTALGEELEQTAGLCRSLGIWAVIGCAHRLTSPNRPHNSLYVISDKGTLVGRYDKRRCSNTEISDWFSPGFHPLTFDIDGYGFGCALCIEIQFPEIFAEYEPLDVDCVLLSAYSDDRIYGRIAQGHAAINCMWLGFSVPAQCSQGVPSSIIGPNGEYVARCRPDGGTAFCTAILDRETPELKVPLKLARSWRRKARLGDIYAERRVDDPRSRETTKF